MTVKYFCEYLSISESNCPGTMADRASIFTIHNVFLKLPKYFENYQKGRSHIMSNYLPKTNFSI